MSFHEPTEQSQKLVTESIVQLLEFDFRAINGSARVFLANGQEFETTYDNLDLRFWDGATDLTEREFKWIDFSVGNLRSDLTGQVAEPSLKVAAYDLWQIADWSTATSNFTTMDYRGLKVRRQRLFYNTQTFIAPQTYFVKSVDELSPTQIVFTLTPSLGTENGNKPSARKFEV